MAIAGTVPTKAQYDRIQTLAKEIKGVTSVTMKVAVAPAKK
jgi:hyperosmotically inducible periplasmic protein